MPQLCAVIVTAWLLSSAVSPTETGAIRDLPSESQQSRRLQMRRTAAAQTQREAPAQAQQEATPQERDQEHAYELPEALTPRTFLEEIAALTSPDGTLADGSRFILMPGDYYLVPTAHTDSTCGNCEDPDVPVEATLGLLLSGRDIALEGSVNDPGCVVIHTGAGYGLLFQDCENCALRGVTVTGGARDTDRRATDAAVVVKRSSVEIEDCVIRDNLGDSTTVIENVVGIIGIAGREGASIEIRRSLIIRNSWDGIALYRGARAVIEDNIIDGVDKARGENAGGGRGVGIGVTWDAIAEIRHNLVTRYWKGIGIFVDAEATVQENIVEDIITWGIAYWDAGVGMPVGRIERNIVYDTGACGISITRESSGLPDPGYCRDNVIARTARTPKYDDPEYYCVQCPLALEAVPEGFEIRDNVFFDNRYYACPAPDEDLNKTAFRRAAGPLLRSLKAHSALCAAGCFVELGYDR